MRKFLFSLVTILALCASASKASAQAHFLRGDSNHDKKIDLSDGIAILGYLFLGTATPPCLDAADVNDTGDIDIADAIYCLNFLFLGGSNPAAPYPTFEADPTPDELSCLGEPVQVSGNITADTTWTRDKSYFLNGAVFVQAGATLTIEGGTTVFGKKGTAETAGLLAIEQGGKIMAEGSETHPVVFTSEQPVGQRHKSDWGGVLLFGKAHLNVAGGTSLAEGFTNKTYGGGANPDDNDSSGKLSYVRIEYGGVALSVDNELNGLTCLSVGSGTQLDHIQVKYNDDDAIEWFGGTVNLKYGVATGVTDDNLDYSFGWQGKVQFYVAHQNKEDIQTSGNGFEVDNSEPPIGTFGDQPMTNPLISNVTMCGPGDPAATLGGQGMLLRRGCGSRIYNVIIAGFRLAGFDIDDAATTANIAAGNLVVDNSVFFQNGTGGTQHCQEANSETAAQKEDDPANAFADTSCNFIHTTMTNNIFATVSPLTDPFNLTGPDFRPLNDALTNPKDPTTLDPFFDSALYRGAVAPTGDNWTQAPWISYLKN